MTARRIGYRANRAMSMENTANERESGQTVPENLGKEFRR